MNLKNEVHLLINRLPDSDAFHQLSSQLRAMPENEAIDIIQFLLNSNSNSLSYNGVKLIGKVINKKYSLYSFLYQGLSQKDVSRINIWLETILPKIGYKKRLSYLKKLAINEPELIFYAWYYLEPMIIKNAPELVLKISELGSLVDETIDPKLKNTWKRSI